MSKRLNGFIAIAFFMFAVAATTRAETFTAYLSSAQEVPTNASTATGFARVVVNEATLQITFTLTFTGLSSNQTASHIHSPGVIGVNGPVVIDFGSTGATSGTLTGTRAITVAQIAALRAHQGYVNVHSVNFGGGEIRGQLGVRRPVDFDGDGRTDLSVLRFPNVAPPGVAPFTYHNLNSTTGYQVIGPWGDVNTGDFPAPGDYDGDGKDDVAIYRAGATAGATSAFWILQSSNNVPKYYAWGVNGDLDVSRDYDGDGITDISVFRPGANVGDQAFWFIRQSSTNTGRIVPFGTTGDNTTTRDVPVPGDYDGDGKFDLAVYRFGLAPLNNFIILRSSDNSVSYVPWGDFNTDYIAPGDFDGDGKFDYVAARTGAAASSPMVWWILLSSNGQTRVQQFGLSSDFPTQGDYDGDARTDIAIFRRGATAGSASNFWIFNSFTNTTQTRQWGVREDFPVATFDAR